MYKGLDGRGEKFRNMKSGKRFMDFILTWIEKTSWRSTAILMFYFYLQGNVPVSLFSLYPLSHLLPSKERVIPSHICPSIILLDSFPTCQSWKENFPPFIPIESFMRMRRRGSEAAANFLNFMCKGWWKEDLFLSYSTQFHSIHYTVLFKWRVNNKNKWKMLIAV